MGRHSDVHEAMDTQTQGTTAPVMDRRASVGALPSAGSGLGSGSMGNGQVRPVSAMATPRNHSVSAGSGIAGGQVDVMKELKLLRLQELQWKNINTKAELAFKVRQDQVCD